MPNVGAIRARRCALPPPFGCRENARACAAKSLISAPLDYFWRWIRARRVICVRANAGWCRWCSRPRRPRCPGPTATNPRPRRPRCPSRCRLRCGASRGAVSAFVLCPRSPRALRPSLLWPPSHKMRLRRERLPVPMPSWPRSRILCCRCSSVLSKSFWWASITRCWLARGMRGRIAMSRNALPPSPPSNSTLMRSGRRRWPRYARRSIRSTHRS